MEKTKIEPKPLKLSKTEEEYLGRMAWRLLIAKNDRDQKHPEFNDRTLVEFYEDNEKVANTYIESSSDPLKDVNGDIVISSGTVEQKLNTLVSEIVRLNLTPEVRSFDKNNRELTDLGVALTDIILKTNEIENDEENKIIRTTELLKQGTVFIQERWDKVYKKVKTGVDKNSIGKMSGVNWKTKLEKVFEGPTKKILYLPGVYLGNIREYTIKRQPFIFTLNVSSYDEIKSRYGGKDKDGKYIWDRWENVPSYLAELLSETTMENIHGGFSLYNSKEGLVEEIHYQDAVNNEFQIFLNGVPMLPEGFPLSAVTPDGEYNIEKQVLQVINPHFAYGRSFTAKTKYFAALIDEILKLLVLKTRKSVHPPYANISGRVISPKSLMPGRITMGIDPNSLVPIGQEGQGATSAEYQMLKELRDGLDRVTVSPQMEGLQSKSGTTALEVSVLAKQAQKVIYLAILASMFLEQKLGYLRLNNILANYFNPIDTEFDEAKQKIKNIYRRTSRRTGIEGRGNGIREVIASDGEDIPDSFGIMDMEDFEGTPEPAGGERRRTRDELGMEPIKKIFLNREELLKNKYLFHVQVETREKDTSITSRRMFREELLDIATLVRFGSIPNVTELEEKHSQVWGGRKEKLFTTQRSAGMEQRVDPNQAKEIEKMAMSNQGGLAGSQTEENII